MKKWLLSIGAALTFGLAGLTILIIWTDYDLSVVKRYVKNETLRTIKPNWPGTPVDQKGRFVNEEFPFIIKMRDLLKWQVSPNPFKKAKESDTTRLEVKDPSTFLNSNADGILWLGHASFLIRLNGINILLDPVFGKPPLIKEYVEVPSPLDKIRTVDLVLISHDHRDHADETTLRLVAQKFPTAIFLGGLGMEDIFDEWKTATNDVRTAGWFQQFIVPEEKVKIFFVPVRHWSRRGIFDTNKRLWGGFVIQSDLATIYFGGDSGYGRHYKEVGELFPKIDYFLIGIGAYEPRWFMEPNHNSPGDALKAFQDSGAKTMVPMHFGRFDLSDEPPNEPLRALIAEANSIGINDKIMVLSINESLNIK